MYLSNLSNRKNTIKLRARHMTFLKGQVHKYTRSHIKEDKTKTEKDKSKDRTHARWSVNFYYDCIGFGLGAVKKLQYMYCIFFND